MLCRVQFSFIRQKDTVCDDFLKRWAVQNRTDTANHKGHDLQACIVGFITLQAKCAIPDDIA
jgi:hypothetical protein